MTQAIADRAAQAAAGTRAGQAMIELMVGLVAVLVLLSGLLQVVSLSRTHTEVMLAAREEAGELAMLDTAGGAQLLFDPDYIQDWDAGPDDRRHSRDDFSVSGSSAGFDNVIVERAGRDDADWEILGQVPENALGGLRNASDPVALFGLVQGEESDAVPVIPAVRSLLYRSDSIDVECEVWMTQLKGIF